jgi:hypothetical protein
MMRVGEVQTGMLCYVWSLSAPFEPANKRARLGKQQRVKTKVDVVDVVDVVEGVVEEPKNAERKRSCDTAGRGSSAGQSRSSPSAT